MFHTILLILHNVTRWAVLLLGVWAIYRAYGGWFGNRPWVPADRRAGLLFASLLGLQFILGILFYVAPGSVASAAMQNFSGVMANPVARFFVLEHSVVMFVAVLISNIGSAMARRAPTDRAKHRRAAILYTITLLIVLAAIPWPFLPYGRPLLRLG